MKLSKHFNDDELLSPRLLAIIAERNVPSSWYVPELHLLVLEHLRYYFGKPVYVNLPGHPRRGLCTDDECLVVGRNLTSMHRFGAYDVTVKGITPTEVGAYIKSIAKMCGIGGIGINESENFTHFDFRNTKELIEWTY